MTEMLKIFGGLTYNLLKRKPPFEYRRAIWHQKEERVQAHILVCFMAYVLWKMLGQMCKKAGMSNEPRKVFDEIAQIKAVDVIMPTRQ